MNKIVREAKEKDMFNSWIPDIEVGDVVELREVWDGNGEVPTDSVCYLISRDEGGIEDYINYEFEILENKDYEEDTEKALDIIVKITNIDFV
ncbi:hypothetical protein [Clostridium perfringens]|uniref:hypothetical protein n=1 Tax=Clostridium perfringens TaxID=1502 RepID=UPI000F5335B5|nr:hypothetical protein [Clostridium perfringens]BDC03426.1 hypothetical protein CP118TE_31350 [Clostridium perfringens E]